MIGQDPSRVGERVALRTIAGGSRDPHSREGLTLQIYPRIGYSKVLVLWDECYIPIELSSTQLIVVPSVCPAREEKTR